MVGGAVAAHHPAEDTLTTTTLTAHERLQTGTPQSLTELELLILILGPSAGANSVAKAAQALLDAAPLAELAWAAPQELQEVPGVGPARAAALVAAFELGRRSGWSKPPPGQRILDPQAVYELMRPVAHAEVEQFHIICLNTRGRLIKTVMVAQGSISQCPVSPRDLIRQALKVNSHSLILVHNHPGGAPDPSVDDGVLTERLVAACELAGLMVRDHVVVAAGGYFSYRETGRMPRTARGAL
jgi:DNA repair protein RadC